MSVLDPNDADPRVIDLNADLGEGTGADAALLDIALLRLVTSANVACGGHAGDRDSMRAVCTRAAEYGVAIGAQVSYVDPEGFGRRALDVRPSVLVEQLLEQICALDEIAHECGSRVNYVKPHGALYNAAADDDELAAVVTSATHRARHPGSARLALLGLAGSRLESSARAQGLEFVPEAFADRAYTRKGRLVPRHIAGSVHHDADVVTTQALHLSVHGRVTSVDGGVIPIAARSLCVHGDTPGALEMLAQVRDALWMNGLTLSSFAPPPRRTTP